MNGEELLSRSTSRHRLEMEHLQQFSGSSSLSNHLCLIEASSCASYSNSTRQVCSSYYSQFNRFPTVSCTFTVAQRHCCAKPRTGMGFPLRATRGRARAVAWQGM